MNRKPMQLVARIAAVAAIVSISAADGIAQAGQCPADKLADNSLPGAAKAPVGIVDTELASIDLSKENVMLEQRRLRLRHMIVAPGGVVPFHSHEDRPALIMVTAGEIFEYSSKCAMPILHKAGEVAREALGTKHWWKNAGSVAVHLTIADIVNDHKPATMEKMM
jgi:quercetin dioxygenase-like cupin family protein